MRAELSLHQLELQVHLGFGKEERSIKQPVLLDITIAFDRLPISAYKDGEGFLCYDALSSHLAESIKGKEFQLIEYLCPYLGGQLEQWLKQHNNDIGADTTVYFTLRLHKPQAPVDGLKGGASFTYTNNPLGL